MADEKEEGISTVKSILVYPIKSCRGISVPQAPITSTGFKWDRQWMIVNSKGRAITQRVEPKLALVKVFLPDEAFYEDWQSDSNSFLEVKAPGMDVLNVPLTKPLKNSDNVSVWEWCGSAMDEGARAAEWFSTYLGKSSRLVRFDSDSQVRPVDPNYAHGYKVMFSDGYPFLLASQGSLNDLNSLLKEPVPIDRFRPNILVDGCFPFSEDLWTEIRINKLTFQGVKLCSRCKVPSIDQETAVVGSEVSETLLNYRSNEVLRPNSKRQKGRVYFGQNMVCKDSLGLGVENTGDSMILKVGDPVFILKMVSSPDDAPA
ncbi:MOSC domain-containing protein 2, mitochondrial-like [Dorcoceras hygrometricum]|uniref:MOSC domain-containing protein 2, mitochondrial-like n=1 Tax=Dorcoceras hygrometricum TaxID=472368 RepID=A0A2Z7CKV5_9LAMI|nr:MOSC domain-containing protein 2, mitochondrial-like [Dorcoceras hygrometricum]